MSILSFSCHCSIGSMVEKVVSANSGITRDFVDNDDDEEDVGNSVNLRRTSSSSRLSGLLLLLFEVDLDLFLDSITL